MLAKGCACKGIRTCLACDDDFNKRPTTLEQQQPLVEYIFCWRCGDKAIRSAHFDSHLELHNNKLENVNLEEHAILISGVFLQEDILTEEEELKLIASIDSFEWVNSQSGRRKQDFGPKINFKKKKVNFAPFAGLPQLDMILLERVKQRLRLDPNWTKFEPNITNSALKSDSSENVLRNFKTVEVCHLEYCPERGSSIDPHFDDFWIWGERLVTFNLLSPTVITLTLKDEDNDPNSASNHCIRVNLPARSFLVLYADARFRYEHSIRRSDISARRLAITYRELPWNFLDSSNVDFERIGKEFISRAEKFI